MVYLDVQKVNDVKFDAQSTHFTKKLDRCADPSDPSNPFVHHAPDPGTEMLPERVKLPSLLERKIHMECAISQIA